MTVTYEKTGIEEIEEMVRSVLVDTLGILPDRVAIDADLSRDLGLDSLDRIELLVDLERYVSVSPTDEELASIRTVGDAVILVERLAEPPRGI